MTRHSLANGTTTTVPINLTTVAIQALVANGASYTAITGTGQANGTFTIPSVPAGTYLLRIGTGFLETSSRVFALENNTLGRPDGVAATVNPTPTTINITNQVPWTTSSDSFIWVVPNLGATFYNFQSFSSTMPVASATTSALTVNFNGVNLVDQNAGDTVWLLQSRFTTDGGVGVGGTVAAGAIPAFSQLNGQPTTVSVALQTPPSLPSLTQSLSWNLNAFSALQPSLPAGTNPRGSIAFSAYPSTTPTSRTMVDSWFSIVTAGQPTPTGFTLSTPFPTGWSISGRVFFSIDTPRQVAGTTAPLAVSSGFGHWDTLAAMTGAPITPRLGAVGSVTLNGSPLSAERTGVGTTLQLSWSPPTLGTPSSYFVLVQRLNGAAGAATSVAETFSFSVGGTSLTVPPNLLIAGQPYLLEIQAFSAPYNARAEFGTPAVPAALSFVVMPIIRL